MDYARTYWLLFLGVGLLFGVQSAVVWVDAGEVTLVGAVSLLVALVIVPMSAFLIRHPDRGGGPEEPNVRFASAVFVFVLLLALTVLQLLGSSIPL